MRKRKAEPVSDEFIHRMIVESVDDENLPHRDEWLRVSCEWYLKHPQFEPSEAFVHALLRSFLKRSAH